MSNGGIIGIRNTPSILSANGKWNLIDQYNAKKERKWPGLRIEYPTPTWSDTDTNNWSFASQSIGTNDNDNRVYYLLISYEDAGTNGAVFASSANVGGIAGTNILQRQTLNAQYVKAEIWRFLLPPGSGTTGTVNITTTGATPPFRLSFGSIVVYNENGYDVDSGVGVNTVIGLEVKHGGGVFVGFVARDEVNVTWNNNLTQRFDSASISTELLYADQRTITADNTMATYSVTQSNAVAVLYGVSVW